MGKHKPSRSKLIIELSVGVLPIFAVTLVVFVMILYRGMMSSFLKSKQDSMVEEINETYNMIFIINYDWFWDEADKDPELIKSEITEEEAEAHGLYVDSIFGEDYDGIAPEGYEEKTTEWFYSLQDDLVRNYYLKDAYEYLKCDIDYCFMNNDYSTIFVIDPRDSHSGYVYYSRSYDNDGPSELGDHAEFDIDEHPNVNKMLAAESPEPVFERSVGFPDDMPTYIVYKPVIVDNQVRAVVGIGYNWVDFFKDVLTMVIGLALALFWGLGICFVQVFLLVYLRAVRPAENMQKCVREYTMTKDGSSLVANMSNLHSSNEFGSLSRDISNLAKEIEHYTSEIVTMTEERQKAASELEMAKNIQEGQLPSSFPAFPERDDFDIYASMTPAKEVGGDFYDFFLIDDDHLALVMADVSGKGIPAALFMMMSKILIHNYAMIGLSPHEVIERTNASICENNPSKMFVTVWFGILEISTGKIVACNAGHEYPVIKQPDGRFELFKDKHGFVVGGIENKKYKEYEFTLEKGGILFVYTDGVPEATDSNTQLYGTDRLIEAMNRERFTSCEHLLNTVHEDVDAFVGEAPQFDDLTMMAIKLNVTEEKSNEGKN